MYYRITTNFGEHDRSSQFRSLRDGRSVPEHKLETRTSRDSRYLEQKGKINTQFIFITVIYKMCKLSIVTDFFNVFHLNRITIQYCLPKDNFFGKPHSSRDSSSHPQSGT